MNEFLAEIYNTRESIGASTDNSDVEKLAEAQLLDEALRAEGVDIDKLPAETILKLAHQLLGDDSALVKSAQEGETPAEEKKEEAAEEKAEKTEEEEVKAAAIAELQAKEAGGEETFEEKVAQADFLGRVMAHSYWNEKGEIEKNAGVKDIASKGWSAAKAFGGKASAKASEVGAKAKEFGGKAVEHGKKGVEFAKAHKRDAAFAGGGLAVGGAAGFAGGHKSKKASAIDMLAEKRAMEWADAHGLLEQSDEQKLAAAVDQRAAKLLAEAGVDVAAVEAAAQK